MKTSAASEIEEARVELVPLIDCVFLLLIFFMCAANMSRVDNATQVKLPIATNGAEQKDPSGRGTVNILPFGSISPDGQIVTQEKPFVVYGKLVDEAQLEKLLKEQLKADPKLKLYVRADRKSKFTVVKRAMNACAAAGIADVIFGVHLNDLESFSAL